MFLEMWWFSYWFGYHLVLIVALWNRCILHTRNWGLRKLNILVKKSHNSWVTEPGFDSKRAWNCQSSMFVQVAAHPMEPLSQCTIVNVFPFLSLSWSLNYSRMQIFSIQEPTMFLVHCECLIIRMERINEWIHLFALITPEIVTIKWNNIS